MRDTSPEIARQPEDGALGAPIAETEPSAAPAQPHYLRDLWYYAMASRRLKRGKILHRIILGEPVLFARDRSGRAFALRDLCPHRGAPLSDGELDGDEVECPFHGWRFGRDGRCTLIPSLLEEQEVHLDRIRTKAYPLHESQGSLWIFMADPNGPDPEPDPARLPKPLAIPEVGDREPSIIETLPFDCNADQAIVGLIDPAHAPFVHRSWFWRKKGTLQNKAKRFVPSEMGFTMARHTPSANSIGYKILGGDLSTEIGFRLPGLRLEHIRAGKNVLCGLTTVTPTEADRCEVNHLIYWTVPWFRFAKPILWAFTRVFLGQDRGIFAKLQKGLRFGPKPMLINEADVQIRWYYRICREWEASRTEGRAFDNPVEERVLKWRS